MKDFNQERFMELYGKVRQWAIDRNLHLGATFDNQVCKLWEEFGELMLGHNKKKNDLIIDSIGDIIVVDIVLNTICEFSLDPDLSRDSPNINSDDWELPETPEEAVLAIPELFLAEREDGTFYNFNWILEGACHYAKVIGLDPVDCLEHSYNEIKDRKGMMINGKFVKEEDLVKVAN